MIVRCTLCGSKKNKVKFSGPIRSGGPNSDFVEGFTVYRCGICEVEFLHPFPYDLNSYYESKSYWRSREEESLFLSNQFKHDSEQLRWIDEIGSCNLRDKVLVDIGCGSGSFLDLTKGIAKKTIGVEPAQEYFEYLKKKEFDVYKYTEEMPDNCVDVAVCFDTIEHQANPKKFLGEIYRVLKKHGKCFLGAPNQDDFLKKIVPEYLNFFYHTSHLYYFSKKSISYVAEGVRFKSSDFKFVHKYDIMNMLVWARDKVGIGVSRGGFFDKTTEENFRCNIEREGLASHFLTTLEK